MLSPLPRRSDWAYCFAHFTQPCQPSPLRYLHSCSGCFRLERLPCGICTHWKAPPFHGARQSLTLAVGYSITSSARMSVAGKVEAAWRPGVEPGSGFPRNVCGMIVEDQLDRGTGRIGGIEKLEEFDELAAAVALPDERVDLAGEQIDPGQQAERAMAFVLMIPREARMAAWHWRQIRCRRGDGLDSRLLVVGDDRDRLLRFLRLGSGFFQDLDLAVDTQNFRHLGLELGVAAFQIVAHLVRLDFLL